MPRHVNMYIKDPTTGVLRLATRSEEQEALDLLPQNFRAEGTWILDEASNIYRQATQAEAREVRRDEPSNWQYREDDHQRSRRRRRRRRRRHEGREYYFLDLTGLGGSGQAR